MNESVKKEIKAARLKIWEIANHLNMSQATLYRKLNNNMTAREKERILKAVKDLQYKVFMDNFKEAK